MSWLFGDSMFAIILMFIIKIIIAILVAMKAWNKGRSPLVWFIYAYFMSIIALIHVFIIHSDEDGILYRQHKAICPECARPVEINAAKCPTCKSDLTEKYLYIPSPPSERYIIFIIITNAIGLLLYKYITPEMMSGVLGGMGAEWNSTVHNIQETIEAMGVPTKNAAILTDKLRLIK